MSSRPVEKWRGWVRHPKGSWLIFAAALVTGCTQPLDRSAILGQVAILENHIPPGPRKETKLAGTIDQQAGPPPRAHVEAIRSDATNVSMHEGEAPVQDPPKELAKTNSVPKELRLTGVDPPEVLPLPRTSPPEPKDPLSAQEAVPRSETASVPVQPKQKDESPDAPSADPYFGSLFHGEILTASLQEITSEANLEQVPFLDPNLIQVSCSSCSLPPPVLGDSEGGSCNCDGSGCVPGRKACCPCEGKTVVGRFLCGLYECICCPDPCYEPHWLAVADSAFFVDSVRPATQMRLRYENGLDFPTPDRGEYFWPRVMTNPNQVEPAGPGAKHGFGKGPNFTASSLSHEDFIFYTEAAAGPVGLFVETPYRHLDPVTAPASANPAIASSGFGDITVGTKTVILDCELLQFGTQFKTFIPAGNFTKGLGTGHVSLEPSLLLALRISSETDLQGQLAYWIPIAGDPVYAASIFHTHFSLNHILWKPMAAVQLIGTAELNLWGVKDGAFTSPTITPPVAVGGSATIVSMGPGMRFVVCDKIDLGVGTAFAVTEQHWEKEVIRVDFRWRF